MTTSEFTYLLEHPDNIGREQVHEFKSIIEKFPYFQPARALYLKGLKLNDSFLYNQELKTTAAYTTDRSVLFDFITSEEFVQNEISDLIKYNFEHLKEIELQSYEDVSSGLKTETKDEWLERAVKEEQKTEIAEPSGSIVSETIAAEEVTVSAPGTDQDPTQSLEIGKPLDFDKGEMHSFSEWLKLTSFKPIVRETAEAVEEKPEPTLKKETEQKDTIDRFLEAKPTMPPVSQDGPKINLAKERMLKPESLMTETLARIYLEQKNYDKAIKAYEILSLKYPEKSGFFADQILAIKELKK